MVLYFGGYILLPRQFQMEQAAAGGAYGPVPTEISNGRRLCWQKNTKRYLLEKVQLSDYYGQETMLAMQHNSF